MTQDRVYRRALAFDAACAELLTTAGSQLDPRVTEALLKVVREAHRTHRAAPPDELAA
jgi:HD-GYP domain-containing protein (c-di-GMP phosphodiesterase class II)